MTARETALMCLRRVHRGAFAAPVLSAALAKGELSAADRGFVTHLVYGSLRLELALDAQLRPFLKNPAKLPPDVVDALRLGTLEILYLKTSRYAAVSAWVEIIKRRYRHLAGLTNAVLRRVEAQELPPATRYGLPEWLFAEWNERFGPQRAEAVAAAMVDSEPLWLLAYHPQATHALIEEGCEVTLGPIAGTLAVRPSKPLGELKAFQRGWVQPQNPASSLPARLLEVSPGERVLDLASGSGVKAAQLAASGAEVTSVELHPKKLERAAANLRRLGLRARGVVHDLRTPPDLPPAPKVLLDAPCTGTGTLRGHPELRTRVTPEAAASLAALQRELLQSAAAVTAPGGVLVYAVCSLTRAEGPEIARWFLETHPDFEAEPLLFDLPADHTPEGTSILPLGGLDGFFIARFQRQRG
jgi:16S rRNA (cytosine967-C5)-methyltransferase